MIYCLPKRLSECLCGREREKDVEHLVQGLAVFWIVPSTGPSELTLVQGSVLSGQDKGHWESANVQSIAKCIRDAAVRAACRVANDFKVSQKNLCRACTPENKNSEVDQLGLEVFHLVGVGSLCA